MFGPMNSETKRSTGISSDEPASSHNRADCSRKVVHAHCGRATRSITCASPVRTVF